MKRSLFILIAAAALLTALSAHAQSPLIAGLTTDRSDTITSGGASQQISAANPTRTYFEFQNVSDTTMYINFGAAATVDTNSFKIVSGGSWNNPAQFCPSGTITVICATTGKAFVAKEH